jgi:hypothetical protein
VDDGFHCTPLVPGCLKALQYVLPCAVGGAQCYLSNEVNSFACAAQYGGSGSRGYAAPDRLESQAWTINPPAAARVPYTT